MHAVPELRQREVETYLRVVAERGTEVGVEAFAFHNLGVFDGGDFAHLLDLLAAADASASFAFLGRDADEQATTVELVDAAGHEVVLHGQRHVACADLPESLARVNVERGLAAIEAASGVRPRAFFAPLLSTNGATLAALADNGVEWTLGRTDAVVPDGLVVVEPEPVVDLELLMAGHSPAETFDVITERAESGGAFLVHPNLLDYFEATDAFVDWVERFRPVSVGRWLETGGVGLVVDAVRPLAIV